MANVDRPFGARVVQGGVAAGYNARINVYSADADRSSTDNFGDIYPGDFVTLESDGKVAPAASGDTILGVVVGVGVTGAVEHGRVGPFDPDNLDRRYLPYDKEGTVYVIDDPNVTIEIQEDDDGTLTEADVGTAVDITAAADTAHGDRTTSSSTVEITDATDNGDVTLLGLVDRVDNEEGAYSKWLVRIANHQFG